MELTLCCCCLLRNAAENLRTPYIRRDTVEIFSDMLDDCFQIQLPFGSEDMYGICEVCVSRLRDASDFKLQAQRCQVELRRQLEISPPVKDEEPFVQQQTADEDRLQGAYLLFEELPRGCPLPEPDEHWGCEALQEAPEVKSEMPSEEDEAADETRRNQEAPEVKSEMPSEDDETGDEMCRSQEAPEVKSEMPSEEDEAADEMCRNPGTMFGSGALSARARQQLAMTCVVRLERLRQSQCQTCHVAADHEASLTTHMEDMHTDSAGLRAEEEACTCDTCGDQFTDKTDLIDHVQTHMSTPFLCKIINSKHSRTPKTPEVYSCNICSKVFSSKSKLKRHGAVHTGRKPYSCDICNKYFAQKGNLTAHIRVHTGQKPYKCEICKQSFAESSKLTIHTRIHTGQKPYKCETCNKRFTNGRCLKRHIRIHTGQKPYNCEICNKGFTYNSDLTRHIRIHTGQKPYQCEICNKRFAVNVNLTQHIRIHTGQKPYQCEICNKGFTQKGQLNRHMRVHAGQKP